MPTYQIDGHRELETQWMQDAGQRYGEKWGDAETTRIWWLVWGASENVMDEGMVGRDWLTGKVITVNYRVADGTAKSAQFSLAGTGDAIVAATGVKLKN